MTAGPPGGTANGRSRTTGQVPVGRHFANRARVLQSWYVAAPSRAVPRGAARSFPLLGRRIALYRTAAGTLHALDARCPHLGADLGHGTVEGEAVRCAFHGWRFGPDGRCCGAPGFAVAPERRTRVYPTLERWGLIWFFNGPRPLFPLPDAPAGERLWTCRLPSRRIGCHPHVVIANGLDSPHFAALHAMEPTSPPTLTVEPPYRVRLDLHGRPRARLLRHLTGSARAPIDASFTTIGGHLAWLAVARPVRFHVLFSGRPTPEGACDTGTVLFLPRGAPARIVRAAILMGVMLRDDRRILDNLDFAPAFSELDAGLRAFAEVVDRIDPW
jgi:phenylpropionate dioxygenase-like ring-hydroxylating dioxygenase large terminal subunit